MEAFSGALATGAMAGLIHLELGKNKISGDGVIALAKVITPVSEGGSGALAFVTILDLSSNKIGDAGRCCLERMHILRHGVRFRTTKAHVRDGSRQMSSRQRRLSAGIICLGPDLGVWVGLPACKGSDQGLQNTCSLQNLNHVELDLVDS